MTKKSRTLEATMRKHWASLIQTGGVIYIDGYNTAIYPNGYTGTITARVSSSNHYYLLEKR